MPTPHRDRLAAALPARAQGVPGGKMPPRWDKDINPAAPLPDYPRPQMTRPRWQSLNGPWGYALTGADAATAPAPYPGTIPVPYPHVIAVHRRQTVGGQVIDVGLAALESIRHFN